MRPCRWMAICGSRTSCRSQDSTKAVFLVDAPAGLSVGWGELVVDSNQPPPELPGAKPPEMLSYLQLGDIRSRAQLVSGWYAIEDGAWRWMAPGSGSHATPLPDQAVQFELQLFFPPDFMRRAGSAGDRLCDTERQAVHIGHVL